MANAHVLKKVNKRMLSSSSCESEDSSTNSSSDGDSFDDEGPKRATYHEWRSFLMKLQTPNPYNNGAPTPNPYKAVAPTHNSYRTDAPTPYKNGTTPNSYRTDGQTHNAHINSTPAFNPYRTDGQTHNPHANGATNPSPVKNTQSVISRIKATSAAINPIRTVTPALTRTITSAPNNAKNVSSISRFKATAPASKHTRTVVPAIKNANVVPPTSRASQTATQDLSASLRSIYETFWSLNSSAKLIHVKSQLDEPSKIYVHKLIKAHSNLVQENSRLKKEKQDLINVIKRIEMAISNETIANLLEPARSTQPKNS